MINRPIGKWANGLIGQWANRKPSTKTHKEYMGLAKYIKMRV